MWSCHSRYEEAAENEYLPWLLGCLQLFSRGQSSVFMRVIKSYVNTQRPGKWLLSCQATGGQRDRRGRGGHLNRKKPTNQLPVRFVARRLCSSCSSRRAHDRICNSLPLFTLRCTGFTSRQCGVVAWLRVTSGKGLSPLIQAHSALCVCVCDGGGALFM